MKKLIQTIQDEINQLNKSRIGKKTDAQLMSFEKRRAVSKDIIQKIVDEYRQSKKTVKEICSDYGISDATYKRESDFYGIERPTRKLTTGNFIGGVSKCHQVDEKIKDIQSGMRFNEYHLKWGVTQGAYYRLKRKLKKDLVD
jgi:DNA invertase Pin-like site-specific DNA recombinase